MWLEDVVIQKRRSMAGTLFAQVADYFASNYLHQTKFFAAACCSHFEGHRALSCNVFVFVGVIVVGGYVRFYVTAAMGFVHRS